MYREYKNLNFNQIDQDILQFWERERVFERSVEERPETENFVFYEGPPSANGMPGIHHVLARAIKDAFCRFQTLNGKRVARKGGWDTHGLPIELAVEKKLGITKEDIGKKVSVDEYNAECRKTVMEFKDRWDDLTRKMGYWVDLKNPYITYENEYIESVWHLLQMLYKKDMLYKGYTIQPYSPAAGTGLSSHEINQPGCYRDVTDTTAVALFEVIRNEKSAFLFADTATDAPQKVFISAWTTTPWTLPSNTGLTVGAKIEYVKIDTLNPYSKEPISVVLAKDLVGKWFGGKNQPEIIAQSDAFLGSQLAGIIYEQLLPSNNEIEPLNPSESLSASGAENAFKVIVGDFVTTSDGTGVVHTAPSFGADDRTAARVAGLGTLTLVDKRGRFVDTVGEFSGEYVKADYLTDEERRSETERLKNLSGDDEYTKLVRGIVQRTNEYLDVNERIVLKLQLENKLFKKEKYVHSYPHCWRTDKPILYYPLDSWFIKAASMRDRMFELNQTINWKPAATGEGRFGKWLENLNDWNLSRSRYWGIPLPIWRSSTPTDGVKEKCIGSVEELREEIEKANAVLGLNQIAPADLHRPYIDDVILVDDNGNKMVRETDLIDVWFDSGAMPYAQWGYKGDKNASPFGTGQKAAFPADFISEGVDQTRGWFYTLHAISTMCFDAVAYKNVISTGLVLDENGNKMSKRLGNAVDPFLALNKYGADPVRWYMLANSDPWDNLKFSWRKKDEQGNPIDEFSPGIQEVTRKFFGTLYNTYNFFALYANVENWVMDEMNVTPVADRPEIDRWVLSRLQTLVQDYSRLMNAYEPTSAARLIEAFVDDLSNWYVRLCRRRFWDMDKAAFETLHECLAVVAQLMSPIAPFFAEWLYKNLTDPIRATAKANQTPLRHESVHLTYLTKANTSLIDKELEQRMDYAQRITTLVLSLRKQERIRVRQPLQRILLPILNNNFQAQVEAVKDLILQEVNIKSFEYITDTTGIVSKKIKPNFKVLGKKLGKNMKAAGDFLAALSQAEIAEFEKNGKIDFATDAETIEILVNETEIVSSDIPGWFVASDNTITVALDVNLTETLIAEGNARELVNRIQTLRKNRDFKVNDKIIITVQEIPELATAIQLYRDYICSETLADDLLVQSVVSNGEITELTDDVQFLLDVERVAVETETAGRL